MDCRISALCFPISPPSWPTIAPSAASWPNASPAIAMTMISSGAIEKMV